MSEPAGWLSDPNGVHELRYWDGVTWTDHVSDQGNQSVDPYQAGIVPPPPPAGAPAAPAPVKTSPRSTSYVLVLLDGRGRTIHEAPYKSPDLAINFANDNQQLRLKHSVGSVLLKGAMKPNIVRWRTATVIEVDQDTGEQTEYYSMNQSRW